MEKTKQPAVIIHPEALEVIPTKDRNQFILWIYDYWTTGNEPSFEDDDDWLSLNWIRMKEWADQDKASYFAKVDARSQAGKIGGANKGSLKDVKQNETKNILLNKTKQSETKNILFNKTKQSEANEANTNTNTNTITSPISIPISNPNSNTNSNSNDLNVSESDFVDTDFDDNQDNFVNTDVLGTTRNYSKQVFDILAEHDLPCAGKNETTFLMRDFRLALSDLARLHIHSDEAIAAVRNYAEVVELHRQGRSWWNAEMPFNSFCKSAIIRFLPDNFKIENYIGESPGEAIRGLEGKIQL